MAKTEKLFTKNLNWVVVVIIGLLGLFLVFNPPAREVVTDNPQPATASSSIGTSEAKPGPVTYQGEDGKTALELLETKAQIEIQGEGEKAFVTSIDGYKPDTQKEYWSFYVNGAQAPVGAGQYQTKNGDTIEWKLEAIK